MDEMIEFERVFHLFLVDEDNHHLEDFRGVVNDVAPVVLREEDHPVDRRLVIDDILRIIKHPAFHPLDEILGVTELLIVIAHRLGCEMGGLVLRF